MKEAIVFEAANEGYSIPQVRRPMTVGQLKAILDEWDDDALVILSFDRGYTYGSLSDFNCKRAWEDEDGEWEEE